MTASVIRPLALLLLLLALLAAPPLACCEERAGARLHARSAESSPEDLLRVKIGREFDGVVSGVDAFFGHSARHPVLIQVLSPPEFEQATRAPGWATALFQGGSIYITSGAPLLRQEDEFRRTLRHEYTHAIVASLTRGKCPAWLDEGLAQALEGPPTEQLQGMLQKLSWRRPRYHLADLGPGFTRLSHGDAAWAYAESYLAVKSLLKRSGRRPLLDLLRALGRGESPDSALQRVFKLSLADLDEKMRQELHAMRKEAPAARWRSAPRTASGALGQSVRARLK